MDGGLANWFSVEPSMTAAFAVVHVTVTTWVVLVALAESKRAALDAWQHGFDPSRRMMRALTRQTAAGPTWMASALAAWLSLLWGLCMTAFWGAVWPLVIAPILAVAFFFPATFKMVLGALVLTLLWFQVVRRFWRK